MESPNSKEMSMMEAEAPSCDSLRPTRRATVITAEPTIRWADVETGNITEPPPPTRRRKTAKGKKRKLVSRVG